MSSRMDDSYKPYVEGKAVNTPMHVEGEDGAVQKALNRLPPRGGFSKASEAVGRVVLGAGVVVAGVAAAAVALPLAGALVAGTAALVAAGVALAAASVVAASPFLAVGGVGLLSYMAVKKGMDAGNKLKAEAKDKGYVGESPVKDLCKGLACDMVGNFKNFFTQRSLEALPTLNSHSDALDKRANILEVLNEHEIDTQKSNGLISSFLSLILFIKIKSA